MSKPKVMFYWCASCGGCEEAVVDLAEDILKVVEAVDIVFWPVALDFKVEHVRALADGEVAVTFLNGAIRTSEQEEMAKLMRAKSQLLVAFGSCAHMGGIPALANLRRKDDILDQLYCSAWKAVNPNRITPQEQTALDGCELRLPAIREVVRALDQVVEVDYYLPGCVPPPDLIMAAVNAILAGQLPARGSVLAPDKPLCDSCPRNASKPDDMSLTEIRRIHQTEVDPSQCFLQAGVLCLGMGTRSGCGERCLNANMPCNGCFGPTSQAADQGAKLLSAVASLFAASDEADIERLAQAVPDPVGTFYRYGLAHALYRKGG